MTKVKAKVIEPPVVVFTTPKVVEPPKFELNYKANKAMYLPRPESPDLNAAVAQAMVGIGAYHSNINVTFNARHKHNPPPSAIYKPTNLTKGLTLCGSIMGCGIMQVRGVAYLNDCLLEDVKSAFELIKQEVKGQQAGCLLATLGMPFYKDSEPILLELGFVKLSEYVNHMHGKDYTQRLYSLKID